MSARDERAIRRTQRVMKALRVRFLINYRWTDEYYRLGYEYLDQHLCRLQTNFNVHTRGHLEIPPQPAFTPIPTQDQLDNSLTKYKPRRGIFITKAYRDRKKKEDELKRQ